MIFKMLKKWEREKKNYSREDIPVKQLKTAFPQLCHISICGLHQVSRDYQQDCSVEYGNTIKNKIMIVKKN